VKLASELTSRARANVYFANSQDIFRRAQFSYVNAGLGNLTFLRRDTVARRPDSDCPCQGGRMKPFVAILAAFLTIGHAGFSQEGSQDPYSEKLVTALASRNAPI